jgi:hypothetical protein
VEHETERTQGRRKRVGNLRQQNEMTWKLQIGWA